MSSAESNPELESFREQWKAEVQSRHSQQQQPQKSTAGPSSARSRPEAQAQAQALATERHAPVTEPPRQPAPQITRKSKSREEDDDDDYAPTVSFDEPIGATGAVVGGSSTSVPTKGEPVTALEHYEKAVEREAAGNHGDSVKLYRKAFRMDDTVDQKYKNKYFSKAPPKTSSTNEPGPATAAPSSKPEQPQSMKQLIASFSTLSIAPAPPEIEGTPRPPCPIASIPDEILIHILRDVAIADVGDFVRLAQVCKRLAFLVATEDRIWRRVCLGTEFGFGGMHYYWQRQITWEPLTDEDLALEAEDATSTEDASKGDDDDEILLPLTLEERAEQHAAESTANTLAFYNSLYSSSWLRMFRLRPRIRFNGCYISTVNYVRAGQANPNLITWNTPLHIVTYYRYLRFFRDGTCISLLTTAEPASVVHHLTREAVALHAGGAAQHLPSAVVQSALKGRWRLSKAADNPGASLSEIEGDLVVETEGVSKYIYRLDLTMKTPGKRGSPKNNKLAWRGHYSYNRLTDDWAPFTLRNDKPFFFSRVKSYGVQGA